MSTLEAILQRHGERALAAAAEADSRSPRRRRRLGEPMRAHVSMRSEVGVLGEVDAIFENPLDGCFKAHTAVRWALSLSSVVARPTSYCHFGFLHRKRTIFVTSLLEFRPPAPCPAKPCDAFSKNGHHEAQIKDLSMMSRNAVPPLLIDSVLAAWTSTKPDAAAYLVIDLFSGWGSLKARAAAAWPRVKVYASDAVDRDGVDLTIDLADNTEAHVRLVLRFAVLKFWPERDPATDPFEWLCVRRVAVLFWVSTPCSTYSTDGMNTHRRSGFAPKTAAAETADKMNEVLLRLLFTAESKSEAPQPTVSAGSRE